MAKIRHLAFASPDIHKLAEYYVDVFKMRYIDESKGDDTIVRITDGEIEVTLINLVAIQERYPNAGPGLHHFGFTLTEAEHEEVAAKLVENYGIKPGSYTMEQKVLDVDGNEFDITTRAWETRTESLTN